MWRLVFTVTALLWGIVAVTVPSRLLAVEVEVSGRPVKREILALYDSRHEEAPHATRIHRFAEMPLNWLGYTLTYRDVNASPPAASELQRVRGVLTWFVEDLSNPVETGRWLEAAVTGSRLRYVVLGDLLPGLPGHEVELLQRLHAHLGLRFTGEYSEVTFRSRIGRTNPEMIGFERPLDKVIPDYPVLEAIPDKASVHLSIESRGLAGAKASAVVVTGPNGGFAAQNFTIYFEPVTDRTMWTLNPFQFFKVAFGDTRFPVPETTTLSGRRIYFSHIDGDGWNNVSEVEGYREAQVLSSEVIAKEAIEPYPDLPVSVALISGDVLPLLGGNPIGARVARRLFALPQVEVASHTHSHPFNWQFFDRYDRAAEERKIDAFRRPTRPISDRISGALLDASGRRPAADQFDKYVAGSDDLPRTYLRQPFDLELEVAGSLKIAESLAPPGKRAKLYQWSGDTTPFEAAIRATRRSGVRNINGGDSRLDREFPSITYVPPVGRAAGAERQIYAGNSNENTYTNDWTGPYFGFFLLEQTLQNTENPRRLKPFNLYYHMYSGEKTAALASIRHFLELARRSPVIPVAASDYAAVADDFYDVEVEQVGLFAWAVTRRGAVQTVRFDDADALVPDMVESRGVIGFTRLNGSMYVSLDKAVDKAIVALRTGDGERSETAEGASAEPVASTMPLLVDARWQVWSVSREACALSMNAQGFGPSQMTWRTDPDREFRVEARIGDVRVLDGVRRSDKDGLLGIDLALDATSGLQLTIRCHD